VDAVSILLCVAPQHIVFDYWLLGPELNDGRGEGVLAMGLLSGHDECMTNTLVCLTTIPTVPLEPQHFNGLAHLSLALSIASVGHRL